MGGKGRRNGRLRKLNSFKVLIIGAHIPPEISTPNDMSICIRARSFLKH